MMPHEGFGQERIKTITQQLKHCSIVSSKMVDIWGKFAIDNQCVCVCVCVWKGEGVIDSLPPHSLQILIAL